MGKPAATNLKQTALKKQGEEERAANPQPPSRSAGKRVQALFSALRPRQWTKNLALFVGLVFAQRLFNTNALTRSLVAFAAFCAASSCIYLLNDLLDLKQDRLHPIKSQRSLASGRLPLSWARTGIAVLLVICALLTFLLFQLAPGEVPDPFRSLSGGNLLFALTIGGYLVLMVLYSTILKHIVILDVFVIAAGFVLRILAGTFAIPVFISPWLYLVTILLALFLALSKRRYELVLLQSKAGDHRQNLEEYSLPLLDQMITIVMTSTLMAYSLYTFQGLTGNHRLMLTIPLVLYGMFRYLYLVHKQLAGGSPEEVLLRDRHMLGTVSLCTAIIIFILYIWPQ